MVSNGVEEISGKQFDSKTKSGVVVVDFFAEWCMPCVMMAPVMEEMKDKFKNKIEFFKVNIDDNSSLAEKHEVMSIPTLIVFKDGKESERFIGAMQSEQLEEKLKKFV
jgi:thioredoxin 1